MAQINKTLATFFFAFATMALLLFKPTLGLPSPFGGASDGVRVSHSGPTNDRWGHEQLVPEEELLARTKKQKTATFRLFPFPVYYYPQQPIVWSRPVVQQQWQQPQPQQAWTSPALQAAMPPDEQARNWITGEHNRYRKMVPASNMRMVYWDESLARSAQAHANTCDFRHSRGRVNIGENIWAAPYTDYSDAIQRWYAEVNNPWCACGNSYQHCCGHYIQLVWANTGLIGCGYARCNGVIGVGGYGRAVLVCHYNPQGNKLGVAAFNYANGWNGRCSECPADQPSCHEGLCYKPSESTALSTALDTNDLGLRRRA